MKTPKIRYRCSQVSKLAKSMGFPGNTSHKKIADLICEQMRWPHANYKRVLSRYFEEHQKTPKPVIVAERKQLIDPNADAFLSSYEWRRVRMEVLKRDGARCCCCGVTPADGAVMHVDHIKPRRIYPQLALDTNNLQVLCGVCNHGKGNWDMTDWRSKNVPIELTEEQTNHMKSI